MAPRDDLLHHLSEVPLFSRCSQRELQRVAKQTEIGEFAADTTIVRQGQAGDTFFVILDGRAVVRRNGRKLGELGPSDFFGELALLDPAPRNADVVAINGPVRVAVLRMRAFRSLIREVPAMNERLLAGLAQRIREADKKRLE